MTADFLFFFTGLFLLYLGAELLVRGAAQLAVLAKIKPLVVGVTVVALGTSSPEFIVSFIAALMNNKPDVAIGNIIGSNIANIALILGVSAMIKTIPMKETRINREVYWMFFVSVLIWIFAYTNNKSLVFYEGIILTITLITFLLYSIHISRKSRHEVSIPEEIPVDKKLQRFSKPVRVTIFIVEIVTGIGVLVYGSDLTINSAVNIARAYGVSEVIIGLTLVAFGTSLPELATALISLIKKENEILIGNIIGSNIFNILFVAGGVSLFKVIPVKMVIIRFDIPVMLIFGLILVPVIFLWNRLPRWAGYVLFVLYLTYIIIRFYI